MEKALATYHFSIILISTRVGVVLISDFLAHASILQPYPIINNVPDGKKVPHHFHLGSTTTGAEKV